VALGGNIYAASMVTGVTVALRGSVKKDELGVFVVTACAYCHPLYKDEEKVGEGCMDVVLTPQSVTSKSSYYSY
jgi:cytochrome c2